MPSNPVVVTLEGHLTRVALADALSRASAELGTSTRPVVVDCTKMAGYDLDAREAFVSWNREHKEQVTSVAIVTTNPLHRIVIAAMRLASGQSMQAFSTRTDADAWLAQI